MNAHTPLLWLTLILLTLISYALTDSSTLPWITGVIVALTAVKGLMIVDGFMELRGVRHWLRRCMNLYCPVLGLLIWLLVSR
ncbi:cytochrome C oxidase subunit IV family protein [Marinobacterium arenosum]|uniref:cytochrome C oxidase subunit IV family protein n=1 Tax=Marinobacterium arenosum TaxID=2862496 RepID=UPI001C95D5BC|nr:cytochrome C oxidase subunit IV family protein [Marinobacterium arenosum]MBY4678098.1 cytochrome C oxidase subunit IV family protein [Marinobacterium arenosum]